MPAYGGGGRGNAGQSTKSARKKARKVTAPSVRPQTKTTATKPVKIRHAAPAQRGHASEGGQTIRPKTIKKVRKAARKEYFPSNPVKALARSERRAVNALRDLHDSDPKRYERNTVRANESNDDRVRRELKRAERKESSTAAPVLKVLDQTTRPLHAIMAAAREDIHDVKHGRLPIGHGSLRAAKRGIQNKDKSTASDVLGDLGVPKGAVRSALGLVGDIALDPTTYVTGGTGSIARKAAASAGKRVEKKAAAKGLTEEQVKRFKARAETQAAKKAPSHKGVTIRVAGKEVPGVRKATAKAAQPVRKITRGRGKGAKALVADVNPNTAAAGASKAESMEAIRATRTARARTSRGRDEAQKKAIAIKRQVSKEDYSKAIDAIESGRLADFPKRNADGVLITKLVRDQFRHANRLRKQAGIRGGERKNYVPHELTEDAREAAGKATPGGVGMKVVRPASSKARKREGPLSELRVKHPGEYNEDLPQVFAHRMEEGHQAVARADLNRRLAAQGTDVKRGMDLPSGGDRAVFQIKGSDIREVTDRKELQRLADTGGKSGRYVILNKDIVKRATEGVAPALQGPGIVRALDKTQSLFKRVAIATPGFHVRNLIGDSGNAYLAQSARTLPGNMRRATKVLKAAGRQDKANLGLKAEAIHGKSTLKTGQYGSISYDEAARGLAKAGAFRTGYTAKEIPELASSGSTKISTRSVLPQWLKRAGLNREDLPRLATAVDALRRGATYEQAAERVATYHFDYQHLTWFERQVARRAAPFYTWSARNIPLQARTLLKKPGKYANFQKLREEASKATGADEQDARARQMFEDLKAAGVELPKGWEKYLTEWEQRNAPIPITWGGNDFTISMGLPVMDLNEFPGAAGKQQAQEYFQKAMSLVSPVAKDPVEYFSNFSFFFRDQIERDYSPNVAAPNYVAALPESVRKDLGIVKIKDKRSGEMVWGWPAKVDYIAKAVPGTPQFVQSMATGGSDRRGRSSAAKALGYMGIKAVPIDPLSTAVALTYERMDAVTKKLAGLRQQGIGKDHPTVEWRKLSDQLAELNRIAYGAKSGRGDAVLPTNGAPPKSRVRRASSSSTSSSGYDLSGLGGSTSSGSSSSGSSGYDLSGLK